MARVGAKESFDEGRQDLEELAGVRVTPKEVERVSEAIGARPTMEDRTVVIQSLMYESRHGYYKNEPKEQLEVLAMTTFLAVFDGHGGDECSNYLVDALPHQIRTHMLDQRENLENAIKLISGKFVGRGINHEGQSFTGILGDKSVKRYH